MAENTKRKQYKSWKEIDLDLLNQMSRLHLPYKDMAAILEVSESTLRHHLQEQVERQRAMGKYDLIKWLWENAAKGNAAIQIWMSKQILDYRDVDKKTEKEQLKAVEIIMHPAVIPKSDVTTVVPIETKEVVDGEIIDDSDSST